MKNNKLSIFIHLFLISSLWGLNSCIPTSIATKAICKTNEAFNNVTRTCDSTLAPNKAPVSLNISSLTLIEDIQTIITLSYSDVDLDLAAVCGLTKLANVSITQPCSCDLFGVCTVGVTGASNYSGAAQFYYSVKANNLVSNSAKATLNITPINDTPIISAILNQSTNEDIIKAVSFTISDVDSALTCSGSVSVGSTNLALVPVANVVITGAIPNCVATITPFLNESGSSDITLTVTDGDASLPVVNSTFTLTVNPVNDAPSVSPFITTQTTLEDTPLRLRIAINDVDSTTLQCDSAHISVTSSNILLLPIILVNNVDITYSGTIGACLLTITPLANQYGTSNLTISVSDLEAIPGIGTSNAFIYNVTPVNDPPVISALLDTTIFEDAISVIPFTISDVDNTLTCAASVSASSSDLTLLPLLNVVFSGSAPNCIATLTPAANQSGISNMIFSVTDGTLVSTMPFIFTVTEVDDPPVFTSTIIKTDTNEGGMVIAGPFKINEDLAGTVDEDDQDIRLTTIVSDNTNILISATNPASPAKSAIQVFYDLNDNGVEDLGEARTLGANLDNASPAVADANAHSFYLKLYPIAGVSGNTNITITATDGTTPITTVFSLIVHPIAALHGGWVNISALGIKTDKLEVPVTVSDIQCNYNQSTDTKACDSKQTCTGTNSPHGLVIPDDVNVLYWDSAYKKCYRSQSTSKFSWIDVTTSCPISRINGKNFIYDINYSAINPNIPTAKNQYYLEVDETTHLKSCYASIENLPGVWSWRTLTDTYLPAKIKLSWNSFVIAGAGADTAVQVYGWNVYRREEGHDYEYITGYLKQSSDASMSISDPTARTFTDTTAVAGKVYYYMVRPLDSTTRHLTVSTPDIFSEVRVLAPLPNYSFVHRWMVNQEVCSNMHMTTTTTPNRVDPTHNYRCPYSGPGETAGYYDIGKDMLVDVSEMGCPYTSAPACTADGCIGIGMPVTLARAYYANQNDVYYDRNSGSCYINVDGSNGWIDYNLASPAQLLASSVKAANALNPPLVNLSQSQASLVCDNREAKIATRSLITPITKHTLPSKKEYIAYSAGPELVSDADLTDIEQGFSLNIQSRCNGSRANGLEFAFSDSNIPSTAFIYTLAGTATSGIRSLYTGSVPWVNSYSTEACSSRYGVQDIYGNVAEWVTDKMTCSIVPNDYTCSAYGSTDLATYDFDTVGKTGVKYGFNMVTGPYNDNGDTVVGAGDAFLPNWDFKDELYGAGKFSFPIGMPINTDIATANGSVLSSSLALPYLLDIGPTSGITTNQLHEDGIIVNGAAGLVGSFAQGGSYLSGNRAGRYSSELISDAIISRPDVGFRCYVPIENDNFPVDTTHTYPY